MQDLYKTLGVSRSASHSEIKKTYRELTRKFHPDKNPGNKQAEERFKDVSVAYDVLSDPKRRELYDEFGEMSLTQGFDPDRARAYKRAQAQGSPFGGGGGGFDGVFTDFGEARETSFDDLLSRLFGGGRVRTEFGGRPRTRHGANIEGEIAVSMLDALHGVVVPLRIEGKDGEGRTLDVKVPAGMKDGGKLRLRGQGGPGHPAGDIILTVHVQPHSRLTREADNLRLTVPITALEAYRGGPIDVQTPWGRVALKLPAGSQNGQTLRVRGHGVRRSKSQGDLLVTLDVRLPKRSSDKLIDALAELQQDENPREGIGL